MRTRETQENQDKSEENSHEEGGLVEKEDYFTPVEQDGSWIVELPALWMDSEDRVLIAGSTYEQFASKKEAEDFAREKEEQHNERMEMRVLEKETGDIIQTITKKEDSYVVEVNQISLEDSDYFTTIEEEFENWKQAKEFISIIEQETKELTNKPILRINLEEGTTIACEDFNTFNPEVAIGVDIELPKQIEQIFELESDRLEQHGSTYEKTTEQENWEQELFNFIRNFLTKDEAGKKILKQMELSRLDLTSLSPREAVEVTMKLVMTLTKYKREMIDVDDSEECDEDEKTVLELLKEGQENFDNPEWEGNGVCRNFASMVKAVFEAIKENQGDFSKLENTYCLYQASFDVYDPEYSTGNHMEPTIGPNIPESGHTWNTFCTLSQDEVSSTIVDSTWGQYDLDTGKTLDSDHTLVRMEPMVSSVAKALDTEQKEELKKILSYYNYKSQHSSKAELYNPENELTEDRRQYLRRIGKKVIKSWQKSEDNIRDLDSFSEEELMEFGWEYLNNSKGKTEKNFFLFKGWDLIKDKNLTDIPEEFINRVIDKLEQRERRVNSEDIKQLWRLRKERVIKDSLKKIFVIYINSLTENSTFLLENSLFFADDELQERIFKSTFDSELDLEKLIKNSGKMRARVRRLCPNLMKKREFKPTEAETGDPDLLELEHYVGQSDKLKKYGKPITPKKAKKIMSKVDEISKKDSNFNSKLGILRDLDSFV